MASSPVLRNTLVQPFSVDTPFLATDSQGKQQNTPQFAHANFFQSIAAKINSSMQVTTDIPAHSGADGTAGTMAFDDNFLYVCVAADTWRRVALTTF